MNISDKMIVGTILAENNIYDEILGPSVKEAHLPFTYVKGDLNSSVAGLYNQIIDNTNQRFIIFAHHDAEFSPDIIHAILSSYKDSVIGAIGRSSIFGYVWAHEVPRGEFLEVEVFDACLLVFDREKGIRFDESFTGLHMAVEDYCYQAREKGYKLNVPHLDKFGHRGVGTYGGNNADTYRFWREKLFAKWHTKFQVRTT